MTLRYLLWESTKNCPCNCSHCHRFKRKSRDKNVNLGKGLWILNVTGGEPFMRRDLAQCINKSNPRIVQISTSGFNPQHIVETAKAIKPFKSISISIEGFEATHNRIRGINIYNQALMTFAFLRMHSIMARFSYTLLDCNIQQALKWYSLHPNTTFNIPVKNEFYGDANPSLNKSDAILFLDEILRECPKHERYYYKHLLETLKGKRKLPCLFQTETAKFLDADNYMLRCHLPLNDCEHCTQLCDSMLHPLYYPLEVLKRCI